MKCNQIFKWLLATLYTLVVGFTSTTINAQPTFELLPGGTFNDGASGVSEDGTVVIGFNGQTQVGWIWTESDGYQTIPGIPGGTNKSIPFAISSDGTVIVGEGQSALGPEAFRWTSLTGTVGLGDLVGGGFSSSAQSVSDDGLVVVGFGTSANGVEAFRWESGSMSPLGIVPGSSYPSRAYDISSDGNVIVGKSGQLAFRWTVSNQMVDLGNLPETTYLPPPFIVSGNTAFASNSDGSVIVGMGFSEPFLLLVDSSGRMA
jgi:probable HAF family extracellular repeat protein